MNSRAGDCVLDLRFKGFCGLIVNGLVGGKVFDVDVVCSESFSNCAVNVKSFAGIAAGISGVQPLKV